MTQRYAIALIIAVLSVLMLAACLVQGCILQAGLVTLLFLIAAAMGTDAELEMRIKDMERAGMLCASVEKSRAIVLKFKRDKIWHDYLMWELEVEDV